MRISRRTRRGSSRRTKRANSRRGRGGQVVGEDEEDQYQKEDEVGDDGVVVAVLSSRCYLGVISVLSRCCMCSVSVLVGGVMVFA